jgi:hypothetical protein
MASRRYRAAMAEFRFVRAHDRRLSFWQSVVAASVRAQLGEGATTADVLAHPMMVATDDHVQAALAGDVASLAPAVDDDRRTAAYVSRLSFEQAVALVDGDDERAIALEIEIRRYSNRDWRFATCITTYKDFYQKYKGKFRYNDWVTHGKRKPDYAVIKWRLPSNAVVGVIGDWGTGLADAAELLLDLLQRHNPDAIIHLGDIYYSGTPDMEVEGKIVAGECVTNYATIIAKAFKAWGKRVPVFTLAGNHDYYALGQGTHGFYDTFTKINVPEAKQQASYFCLRTVDEGWQFLAMDSGLDDADPLDLGNPLYAGPTLQPSEIKWLQHQISSFPGVTVLLSHNQVFSAHAELNGKLSSCRDLPYLNPYLLQALAPYFNSDVAAWLWGHEHNFALYRDGLYGLAKGRLVGCSAYEEFTSPDPYTVNYPEIPYLDPTGYRLEAADGYYNHGYAVVKLGGSAPPTIEYHEYPSWGANKPSPLPPSKLIYSEKLARPAPPSLPVTYGTPVELLSQEGFYIGPLVEALDDEYYPTARGDAAAALAIAGGSGTLRHGDRVQIKTTEPSAGKYNLLGVFEVPPGVYYYTPGHESQTWIVNKRDPTTPEVRYGEQICFVNVAYADQSLKPSIDLVEHRYLTTGAGDPYYWTAS